MWLLLGTHEENVFYPRKDTDNRLKKMIPPKSSLVDQWVYWGCLHGIQRQLHHQKATPALVTIHKSWKPGPHCTTSRQFKGLEYNLSLYLSWPVPLSDSSTPLCFSHGAWLVYKCSQWSKCCIHLMREKPSKSTQFQELPKAITLFTSWI